MAIEPIKENDVRLIDRPWRKMLQDKINLLIGHIPSVPSKVYRALISQTGTDAPTVVILENTIGNIVWTRDSAGTYFGTLAGAFTTGKVFLPSLDQRHNSEIDLLAGDENYVEVNSYDASDVLADDLLAGRSLEIRVYP